MRIADVARLRHWIVSTLAVAVVAIASGFTSCATNGLLPFFGPVQLTPTSLAVTCASPSATFVAAQTNFTGTFSASSSNTSAATVAATSPPNTFVVTDTGTSSAGATITVTGALGSTATLPVTTQSCSCVRHRDMWTDH